MKEYLYNAVGFLQNKFSTSQEEVTQSIEEEYTNIVVNDDVYYSNTLLDGETRCSLCYRKVNLDSLDSLSWLCKNCKPSLGRSYGSD